MPVDSFGSLGAFIMPFVSQILHFRLERISQSDLIFENKMPARESSWNRSPRFSLFFLFLINVFFFFLFASFCPTVIPVVFLKILAAKYFNSGRGIFIRLPCSIFSSFTFWNLQTYKAMLFYRLLDMIVKT